MHNCKRSNLNSLNHLNQRLSGYTLYDSMKDAQLSSNTSSSTTSNKRTQPLGSILRVIFLVQRDIIFPSFHVQVYTLLALCSNTQVFHIWMSKRGTSGNLIAWYDRQKQKGFSCKVIFSFGIATMNHYWKWQIMFLNCTLVII